MSGCECKRDSAQPSKKGGNHVQKTLNEILRTLGRIEGELVEIRKLAGRVRRLEIWQSWIKGGWAAIVAAYLYLCRTAWGK
jgi:hypothetical protein